MPGLDSTLKTILDETLTALTGLKNGANTITLVGGVGWPAEQALHNLANQNNKCILSVDDRKTGAFDTRWLNSPINTYEYPTGITATLDNSALVPGQTTVLTLSYAEGSDAVNENDAAALVIRKNLINNGAVAMSGASETLATLAAKLATAINAESSINQDISAQNEPGEATVTLENISSSVVGLKVNCGNIADQYIELGRNNTQAQIVIWTNSAIVRRIVGDALETFLASTTRDYGLVLQDGSMVKMHYRGSSLNHDDTQKGLYRRDFIASIEFGISKLDHAYSVLVPKATQQIF